ncbi:MAG: hypothetical protein M1840_007089 [Geoglossum simile]|nr:MAG: hypothetical protein M1840_007089 [Geoglossum simile]
MSQMEQKLDGLVALLAQPENARTSSVGPGRYSTSQSPNSTGQPHQSPAHLEQRAVLTPSSRVPRANGYHVEGFPGASPAPHQSPVAQECDEEDGYQSKHPPQNRVGRESDSPPHTVATDDRVLNLGFTTNLVDGVLAQSLLSSFRLMSEFFPFVVFPTDTTCEKLHTERPMALLAILMTASWNNRSLQMTLEEQYRRELATKTIIDAQKSLGLLQSILIYLAWYHFHFRPQTQQIYQLLQLAIGMAIDLGYNHKKKKPLIDITGKSRSEPMSPSEEREAQRALLGCYYLSSTFSVALSRPNLFRHTEYMTECGRRLESDLEFSSDKRILHLISLRRIDDRINDTFRLTDSESIPANNLRLQLSLQLLQSQVKEWKGHNPIDSYQYGMGLACNFTSMELHSVGLRMAPSLAENVEISSAHSADMDQFNILLSCLDAGKAYLDNILSVPPTQYRLFSFVEWMRLPYVLLIISKLASSNDSHVAAHWNIRTAQERVRLDLYLESLCYRMQSITTYSRPSQPYPDFFACIKIILERTRHWYVHSTRPNTETTREAAHTEDSPLENIQDPYPQSSGGGVDGRGTQRHVFNEISHTIQQPTRGVTETPTLLPDIADFEYTFLDNAFWTSGEFDPSMFPEVGDMGI